MVRTKQGVEPSATNLDHEIFRVVMKYTHRETATSALAKILDNAEQLRTLQELLEAHVGLIKERSQNLAEAQVTIYDKALLNLTLNGTDLTNVKALGLFAEEILGVVVSDRQSGDRLKNDDDKENNPPVTNEQRTSFLADRVHAEPIQGVVVKDFGRDDVVGVTPYARRQTPAEQLFQTLEIAKAEYRAVRNFPKAQRVEAATFMRDTAENITLYLRGESVDRQTMADLEAVYAMASADAVTLNEGRKRKFELTAEDRRAGAPMRDDRYGVQPTEASPPAYHQQWLDGRAKEEDGDQDNAFRRGGDGRRDKDRRSMARRSRGEHSGNGRNYNDEQIRAAVIKERRASRQAGERRPNRYVRDVDSYVPGQ